MSTCMSSLMAAAGNGRSLAAVEAALEAAGQVAGVDATSAPGDGLGPGALLRSFSLEESPMRAWVLCATKEGQSSMRQAGADFASQQFAFEGTDDGVQREPESSGGGSSVKIQKIGVLETGSSTKLAVLGRSNLLLLQCFDLLGNV
jgi:hypothetical protein